MLATLGERPDPSGWGFELKWDGVRAVVYLDGGAVHVVSRNDLDVSAGYPELRRLADLLPGRRAILDGEIVALNASGVPSFAMLQQRMHVRAPTAALLSRVPVQLYLFDLPYLDRASLLDRPYTERRRRLEELGLDDGTVRTPPYWTGDDARDLMDVAVDTGLEGVVAKRLDSPYQPGTRSRLWVKTPLNTTTEVVLGGWKPGTGRRAGMIGSLLMGAYDATGHLAYLGKVGTGLTDRMLRDLARTLAPLGRPTSPFGPEVPREDARDAHWLEPRLVGEVEYRTVSPDGRLRHSSWRGLRADKDPREVGQPQGRR
jgi:bifunctional non-homologous end joining protein LigD